MDTVAAQTGSVGTILIPLRGHFPNLPVSASVHRAMENYFREEWHIRNERFRSFDPMMRHGVADDFDFTSAEEKGSHIIRNFLDV